MPLYMLLVNRAHVYIPIYTMVKPYVYHGGALIGFRFKLGGCLGLRSGFKVELGGAWGHQAPPSSTLYIVLRLTGIL